MAAFITFATIVLSLRDLFVSPQHKDFSFFRYVPQWPWYSWALIGLVGLILLTLEGSYSKFQREQIRLRSAYRAKRKERDAHHRSELMAARLQELARPHQVREDRPQTEAAALLVSNQEEQAPPKPGELPSDQPAFIDASGRIILNVTPEYLIGLYKEHTTVQANKLIEVYIGKWLRVSGRLANNTSLRAYILLSDEAVFPVALAVAEFHKRWVDHVATLRLNTQIELLGKIVEADSTSITLTECELI